MVGKAIDIKSLNLEELSGVVSIYPWFGAARKELCRRMSELGEGAWSEERYADAALYVSSRRIIADLAGRGREADYSDSEVKQLLESFLPKEEEPEQKSRYVIVGGDYFSRNEYENVRTEEDGIFSKLAKQSGKTAFWQEEDKDLSDFCTETLAQIYIQQGYLEQAKEIYSKLSLLYPEKNAYFASLIENIKTK